MKARTSLFLASLTLAVTELFAQVTPAQTIVPPVQPSGFGNEVDIHDNLLISPGEDSYLYERCGADWNMLWSSQIPCMSAAIGTDYFAIASTQITGVWVHSRTGPSYSLVSDQIPSSAVSGEGIEDNTRTMAFAGNDLAFYLGTSLEIYSPPFTAPFTSSNHLSIPVTTFSGLGLRGSMAATDDRIALFDDDNQVRVYDKSGSTWSLSWISSANPLPNGARISGIALHDNTIMISGEEGYGTTLHIMIYEPSGSNWADVETISTSGLGPLSFAGTGTRIEFTRENMFVFDWSDALTSRVYRNFKYDGTSWNNELDPIPVGSYYGSGTVGLDADNGYLAVGNYGEVLTFDICGPDGTSCDTDCDPNTSEIWSGCNCISAITECVELTIQYKPGALPTNWEFSSTSPSFTLADDDQSPPSLGGDVTYTYNLPSGAQASPVNYDIFVHCANGATSLKGWTLKSCTAPAGEFIIDNGGTWLAGSTTTGPGCGSSSFVDFQLPVGGILMTNTSSNTPQPLRWGNCSGTGQYFASWPSGGSGYLFQVFSPNSVLSIVPSNCTSLTSAVCSDTRSAGSLTTLNVHSFNTNRVRRGVWLNWRVGDASNNFGPVCKVCFESTAPVITCPAIVNFNDNNTDRMVIETDYSSVTLWPNPSSDGLVTLEVIDLDENMNTATIDVVDGLGRMVRSEQLRTGGAPSLQTTLDLGSVPTGLYLVRISSGDRVLTERWVKE